MTAGKGSCEPSQPWVLRRRNWIEDGWIDKIISITNWCVSHGSHCLCMEKRCSTVSALTGWWLPVGMHLANMSAQTVQVAEFTRIEKKKQNPICSDLRGFHKPAERRVKPTNVNREDVWALAQRSKSAAQTLTHRSRRSRRLCSEKLKSAEVMTAVLPKKPRRASVCTSHRLSIISLRQGWQLWWWDAQSCPHSFQMWAEKPPCPALLWRPSRPITFSLLLCQLQLIATRHRKQDAAADPLSL